MTYYTSWDSQWNSSSSESFMTSFAVYHAACIVDIIHNNSTTVISRQPVSQSLHSK